MDLARAASLLGCDPSDPSPDFPKSGKDTWRRTDWLRLHGEGWGYPGAPYKRKANVQ